MKSAMHDSKRAARKDDNRPDTLWNLIGEIQKLPPEQARNVVLEMCERYREAVTKEFGFLIDAARKSGFQHPSIGDSQELAHDFLFVHVIERDLFRKADQSRGRFRDLLWKCLEHYWIEKLRAIKPTVSVDELQHTLAEVSGEPPGTRFDREVARSLCLRVMSTLAEESRKDRGKEEIFVALRPYILTRRHGVQNELAASLRIDPGTVSRQLHKVKSNFLRKFQAEVRRQVWDPSNDSEVKDEADYLLSLLSESWEEIFGIEPPN